MPIRQKVNNDITKYPHSKSWAPTINMAKVSSLHVQGM